MLHIRPFPSRTLHAEYYYLPYPLFLSLAVLFELFSNNCARLAFCWKTKRMKEKKQKRKKDFYVRTRRVKAHRSPSNPTWYLDDSVDRKAPQKTKDSKLNVASWPQALISPPRSEEASQASVCGRHQGWKAGNSGKGEDRKNIGRRFKYYII